MFKNSIYFDNIVALAEGPDLTCHKTGIALRIYRPPHSDTDLFRSWKSQRQCDKKEARVESGNRNSETIILLWRRNFGKGIEFTGCPIRKNETNTNQSSGLSKSAWVWVISKTEHFPTTLKLFISSVLWQCSVFLPFLTDQTIIHQDSNLPEERIGILSGLYLQWVSNWWVCPK